MFFKNLTVFRFVTPEDLSAAALDAQLEKGAFRECQPNEARTAGWMPATAGNLENVIHVDGAAFLALGIQTKLLPAAAVNEEVAKRTAEIAEQQGFKPGRKQLRELKERVIEELLPKALKKTTLVRAVIDMRDGWLMIDAPIGTKVDAVIDTLHMCLDELPLKLLRTALSPSSAMADWLAGGDAPTGFTIDQDCQLKAIGEEKSTVTYARQSLESVADEIKEHLAAGKLPTKLALTWGERISFVLTEKFDLRRLSFLDITQEAADQNADTAADKEESDRHIMLGELRRLLPAVIDALGGERGR